MTLLARSRHPLPRNQERSANGWTGKLGECSRLPSLVRHPQGLPAQEETVSQPWMSVVIHQPAEWTPALREAAAQRLRKWADEVPGWPQPKKDDTLIKRLDWFEMESL